MGSAVAVGLMVEEHRAEIHEAWTDAVRAGLPGEPALEFTVGPLLRELSLALRDRVGARRRLRLVAAGGAAGRYHLTVNGNDAGTYTAGDLAHGIMVAL